MVVEFQDDKVLHFLAELQHLINSLSLENVSNTPDHILAEYLYSCLMSYNAAVTNRAAWYGRMDEPGRGSQPYPKANNAHEIND